MLTKHVGSVTSKIHRRENRLVLVCGPVLLLTYKKYFPIAKLFPSGRQFPSGRNQRHKWFLVLSFYDETSTIVDCVTVRIVASAVFCSSRISCLKFHFESDHIAFALTAFKYSYRGYSKKKCDVSSHNKDKATRLVPLKTCTKNKTTSVGVEME